MYRLLKKKSKKRMRTSLSHVELYSDIERMMPGTKTGN